MCKNILLRKDVQQEPDVDSHSKLFSRVRFAIRASLQRLMWHVFDFLILELFVSRMLSL
jgi:hypothetical protein